MWDKKNTSKPAYTPTWKAPLDKLKKVAPEKMDAQTETKLIDGFLDEREKEMAISSTARNWEKDRKKEWNKNKPAYLKSLEKSNPLKEVILEIKNGGWYNEELYPINGYVLVKVLEVPKQLESGIYLPNAENKLPNVCEVIRSTKGFYTNNGAFIESFIKAGEKYIYRKGAGMEVRMKGRDLLFLTLDDFISKIGD